MQADRNYLVFTAVGPDRPGLVDELMTRVKPVIEYERVGGLYLADLTLSSFGRQDVTK